jgi:thioredoxin reductase (NADPH)
MIYDIIIIGSGPAGLTAGIYAARANLKTLIIAGTKWGGQLQLTTLVENFPGFPHGIQGPELMGNMRKQVERLGVEIIDQDFFSGNFANPPAGGPFKITAGGKEYTGKAIIIATGSDAKWLGVPGEKEKIGRGVSVCAPCDGFFFKEKNVIVVGGGDSALEEAIALTKFAKKITVVYRKDTLRACQLMQKHAKENPKISFLFNSEIIEILGKPCVKSVKIKNNKTSKISEIPIDGVFVAIGHAPNSKAFSGIETDDQGYIKVFDHAKTNIEGIFVAGDVHDNHYQQAIIAAGYGAQAALEAECWLESSK